MPKLKQKKFYHDENWVSYFSNINDELASTFVDLGLVSLAPLIENVHLVLIKLKMNFAKLDGLSSNQEYELLIKIEDSLSKKLDLNYTIYYVGRITKNGFREFYFYVDNILNLELNLLEEMENFPEYDFTLELKKELDWDSYLNFLYPNPREMQTVENQELVYYLENKGDDLFKERMVDHWINFKTDYDRNLFLEAIFTFGFEILLLDYNLVENFEFPYSLNIARVDKVDIDSVNEYCLDLWELAEQFNGEYNGWGCEVQLN
jgi:uncharacterized protein (TIGR01619 family)